MARTSAVEAAPNRFTAEAALPKAADTVRRGLPGLALAPARLLHLACCRLLTFDPWMRRLIPLLLVLFLVLIMLVRGLALYEERRALEAGAAAGLQLAASYITGQITTAAEAGLLPAAAGAAAKGAPDPQSYLDMMLAQFARSQVLNPAAQIWVLDKNGRPLAASAAARSAGGPAPGEALGSRFAEARPLLILGNAAGVMAVRLGETEGLATYAEALKAPYGVFLFLPAEKILEPWRRAVSVTVSLLGSITCLMLVLVYAYFAQGARARAALAATDKIQSRIDTAMLRGRCGLWDWDMARGRIYWSHSMYEMLGYRPCDSLLSISEVASIIDADDLDLFEIAKSAMSGEKEQFDITVPMRHANGRAVWMRIRAQVLGGDEPHLVGISFDVSEQQELAEKNAAADMRIRDAIENISEAFVLWDADNKLVMSNSKYREYSDLEKQLLQIRNRKSDRGQAALKAFARPAGGAMAGAGADKDTYYSGEITLSDGRWLKLNSRQTKDGGFVSVGTDISELKEQQRKLENSKEEFIGTIRDLQQSRKEQRKRESEILKLNRSLTVEKKRAEDANLAKSEFLANMSHELRTPLNAVIGFSQMILQNSFGPLGNAHYEEYITDIYNSGRHLLTLINEILDMSKIEAGRFTLDCSSFDCVPVLEEALRAVSVQREEKQISLAVAVEKPLWLEADSRALRQVALNLLSNAVKFTPKGGQIRVRAKAVKGRLLVSIADSGIGIPKAAIAKLGRPFEQVENQFTKTHEGSGLGLAISRSLVEMHRGRLRVFSRENSGTIVAIALPLRFHKARAAASAAAGAGIV